MAQSGGGGRARRGAGEESADGARLTALAASRSTDSIGCVSLRLNRSSERRGPGGELGGCEDRVTQFRRLEGRSLERVSHARIGDLGHTCLLVRDTGT